MNVLAIDPGSEKSAWLVYNATRHVVVLDRMGIVPNEDLRARLREERVQSADYLAIEMVASYGMAVGVTTFETCVWIGRFVEAWGGAFALLYRRRTNPPFPTICMHLCKNHRAKETNIRQALLDRFPATGGGKTPQIGTKKQPGPLYGVTSHLWSALAVAVTWADTQQEPSSEA